MPSTNKTPNYALPQYVPTDKPSFTKEISAAYLTIDQTMKANADKSVDLQTAINQVKASAEAAAASAAAAAASAQKAQTAADNAVNLLVALGVTDAATAAAFKAKVDNAVPKYAILASYFDSPTT